jgi:hypothetical protein
LKKIQEIYVDPCLRYVNKSYLSTHKLRKKCSKRDTEEHGWIRWRNKYVGEEQGKRSRETMKIEDYERRKKKTHIKRLNI